MQMSVWLALSVAIVALPVLFACEPNTSTEPLETGAVRAKTDPVKLKQGRELYLKNCTVCHGINAEGATDWRQRVADGKFPAPPLNGTGPANRGRIILLLVWLLTAIFTNGEQFSKYWF